MIFKKITNDNMMLYAKLIEQLKWVESYIKTHNINRYEEFIANEALRDTLLLKFILFQQSIEKEGKIFLERFYKLKLDKFSWLDAEYFDNNYVLHYDCVWNFILDIRKLKKEVKKIIRTPSTANDRERIRCSFCGKKPDDVEKTIAGNLAYICNECIEICNEILADEAEQDTKSEEKNSQ